MASRSQLDQLVTCFASGNKAEFARMIGITKQSLNSWYNNEYLDIGKVLYAFPMVSSDWLLTGEGEMLTEKRPPVMLQGDKLIPLIQQEALLHGRWDDSESFIFVRGDNCFNFDFMTRLPNRDLESYIYAGSLMGCKRVSVNEMIPGFLYIIQTKDKGTFFVKYEGEEKNTRTPIHKFSTIRTCQEPDIKLAVPSGDILQCALISHYSVDYENDKFF